MGDDSQAVSTICVTTSWGRSWSLRRVRVTTAGHDAHHDDDQTESAESFHNENTNSIPPQLVHRARSGNVVPRSRTSYGRFAATSPAISNPMSPPIPEYTAMYCLPSGPR